MTTNNPNDPIEYIIKKAVEEGNINQAIAMRQFRMHEELNRKREQKEMEDRIVKRVLSAINTSIKNQSQKPIEELRRSLERLNNIGKRYL